MSTSVELAVLGPFRARVDGKDITHTLSRTQRTLLALLAAAWQPVDKLALAHAAGFAASSIDSQLSRLRVLLRAPSRLHRSRHATPGTIDLDPAVVATDVARYRRLLAEGTAAFDRGDDEAALALLLAADDVWRGDVLADIEPVQDATGLALVAPLIESLHAVQRHGRELAARSWLAHGDTRPTTNPDQRPAPGQPAASAHGTSPSDQASHTHAPAHPTDTTPPSHQWQGPHQPPARAHGSHGAEASQPTNDHHPSHHEQSPHQPHPSAHGGHSGETDQPAHDSPASEGEHDARRPHTTTGHGDSGHGGEADQPADDRPASGGHASRSHTGGGQDGRDGSYGQRGEQDLESGQRTDGSPTSHHGQGADRPQPSGQGDHDSPSRRRGWPADDSAARQGGGGEAGRASGGGVVGVERLVGWARGLRDSEVCWWAAALAVLARDGVAAAQQVAAEWRVAASIERDAAGSARFGELTRLIGSGGPTALRIPAGIADLLRRAEDDHLAGRWDDAEQLYLTAADQALADGNLVAEAEAALAMARLTWDPGRFEGKLDARMDRIVDALPADETQLRARLYACLAGGLYQDGSAGSDQAVARARQALELVSGLGDPLTAAEVLSRARKALIDVDEPQRQIERSGWILNQAGGSDYHRSLGHLATIVDSLLLDRVDQARQHTELYREIAERTGSRFHRYHVAALDGLWALHDGRHGDVVRFTAQAEELGAAFGGVTVLQVVEGQRLWSACEQGDHDEMRRLRPVVELAAGLGLPIPVWELTAAYVAGRLGDHDEAWQRLAAVAVTTDDFAAVPRGALRIAALGMATLVCADLSSHRGRDRVVRAAARGLHAALVDHPARGVLIGWPTIYLGPKQRFVDLAASGAFGGGGGGPEA